MDSGAKACIINVAIGGWYPKGQQRLVRSLVHHGFNHDILTWDNFPNDNYDKLCPYNIKPAALEQALNLGYTHILWLDSSVWAVNDPNKMFDIINGQGYYLGNSGYNCAQTCNDKTLKYFGVTRDEAEEITDCASGILGLNVSNPIAKEFAKLWIKAGKDGAYEGSREHDNQSKDPRFLFHRQDQSAASIIAHKLGMKLTPFGGPVAYYEKQLNEETIFTLRGM
jgi:hypothetical protein